ncbi:suppressor of cytokine signaling 2-like [Ptychodera flava]|uniref:suppressor of cytokine signaling 2-like n=1 Tax=Ptychodera flava TaxID=63121 RepID=UPI003969F867
MTAVLTTSALQCFDTQLNIDMSTVATTTLVSLCLSPQGKMAQDDNNGAEQTLGRLPGGGRIYQYYQKHVYHRHSQLDLDKIVKTLGMLEMSCWYHGAMSSKEAKDKLRSTPTGTFLIRDSQDPRHLFSLSVKTHRGTTSVRIEYTSEGKFRLDSDESIRDRAPVFDCVVKLIAYYMDGESTTYNPGKQLYWLEPSGRKDVPVKLSCPLKADVPTLQHLCRLSINRSLKTNISPKKRVANLPLPGTLKNYLMDYQCRQ